MARLTLITLLALLAVPACADAQSANRRLDQAPAPGGRALGAAAQQAEPRPEPQPAASRKTINADGEVETVLPDGSRRLTKPGRCGFTTVFPDGRKSVIACNQVPVATPPFPDAVSAKWLDAHSAALLEIIRSLLGNDQVSLANYTRATEPATLGIYDRIGIRAATIGTLTTP